MLQVIVTYQTYENYGAHDWDGTGVCPQHWKAKGCHSETLMEVTPTQVIELGSKGLEAMVMDRADTRDDEYYDVHVSSWELVDTRDPEFVEGIEAAAQKWREWGEDRDLALAVSVDLDVPEHVVWAVLNRDEVPAAA